MSRRPDPDLDDIFGKDPELRAVARFLSLQTPPDVRPDPAFRSDLRRRLMHEAYGVRERRPSLLAGLFAPPRFAWASAAVGVVLIGLVAILMFRGGGQDNTVLPPTSPLDRSQEVGVSRPIELDFNQPMDHQSVEQAVQVEPATPVKFDWRGNTLLITPITGTLAPNTQYQVALTPGVAKTTGSKPLEAPTTITFVTQPTPSPKPTVSPSPSATPSPVSGEKALTPIGASAAQWSADGATLYLLSPDGHLQSVPAAGGDVKTLADGVKAFALSANGVFVQRDGGVALLGPGGLGQPIVTANPVALGAAQGKLEYVEGKTAYTAAANLALSDAATAAWFSPAGDRLAYQTAGGLRLLDLAAGRDVAVAGATAFLAWAPDGRRLAYQGSDGLYTTADGGSPAKVAALTATALSWSGTGDLLVAVTGGLSEVGADGSNLRQLASGDYELPVWAPSGEAFAFNRAGQLYTAQVAAGPAAGAPGVEQTLKVLDGFEQARLAGDQAKLRSYLDPAAQAAFTTAGLKPLRYFVVLAQPGQATVRLVLGDKAHETAALDETLYLQSGSGGQLLIDRLADTPQWPLGHGPQLLSVKVSGGQLELEFDSFLAPAAGRSVSLKDAAGHDLAADASVSNRLITLVVHGGLEPGAAYRLAVSTALKDVNGNAFPVEETVPVLGPAG